MPKLLHTFCCCIRREKCSKKNYKQSNLEEGNNNASVNLSSLMTQATKADDFGASGERSTADDGVRTSRHHFSHNAKAYNAAAAAAVATNGNNNTGGCRMSAAEAAATTAEATVTEGQTTSTPTPPNTVITVTSPMPTEQFVLPGTPASIADFKEKEKYKESLLPMPHSLDQHKKCLIVDLDETLVHSSFKPVKNADFIIPIEIDNVVHQVYVLKRPYADEFLERIGMLFECVLFTASLAKYADPVADLLDKRGTFRSRLFREACVLFGGNYVKDLDRLGRDLKKVVIIDNSPASYAFHPQNAMPVQTWFDDPHDSELLDILPMLEELAYSANIYASLKKISNARRDADLLNNIKKHYNKYTTTPQGCAYFIKPNNNNDNNNVNNNNNDKNNNGNNNTMTRVDNGG